MKKKIFSGKICLFLFFIVSLFIAFTLTIIIKNRQSVSAKADSSLQTLTSATEKPSLSEMSVDDCITFLYENNIEIPAEFTIDQELGEFVKAVITKVENEPDVEFAINYPVTADFAEKIKYAVIDYYDDDLSQLEQMNPAKCLYSLKDSTLWSNTGDLSYNCYAFAIDKREKPDYPYYGLRYQPGDFSGSEISIWTSIEEIASVVKQDLEFLQFTNIQISTECPQVDSDTKLICVRKGAFDYHFMKYDNGVWYHKPGKTAILKYIYQPTKSKKWTNEYIDAKGKAHFGLYTYTSDIYYISYGNTIGSEYFGGGTGTYNNPFLIENETHFRNMSLFTNDRPLNGGWTAGDSVPFMESYYKLMNDITITGNWTPFSCRFGGDFNGNYHTIKYSTVITEENVSQQYFGLFGSIGGYGSTKIYNLTLHNCEITTEGNKQITVGSDAIINVGILTGNCGRGVELDSVKVVNPNISVYVSSSYAGGIAGVISMGTLKNCEVTGGTINCYSTDGVAWGGMAGTAGIGLVNVEGGKCQTTITKYHYVDTDKLGPIFGNSQETFGVTNNVTINKEKDTCVAEGTLITLADGRKVPVETLTGGEMLLVWNMFTGSYDYAPILFIDRDEAAPCEVITLSFSDGTSVRVIYEHAFFDYNLNEYVFLRSDAAQYIGHWFNKQTDDLNGWEKVQLTGVEITVETVVCYSPVTCAHLCYYVNGMLSMPGATEGFINIFEVDGETMRYNAEKMAQDIAEYGLFTYGEFNELFPVPEEIFEAVGAQYLKVSLAKGFIDEGRIAQLISTYERFWA